MFTVFGGFRTCPKRPIVFADHDPLITLCGEMVCLSTVCDLDYSGILNKIYHFSLCLHPKADANRMTRAQFYLAKPTLVGLYPFLKRNWETRLACPATDDSRAGERLEDNSESNIR